jgi:hypothetical protein
MTTEAPPTRTAPFDPLTLVVIALAGAPVASLLAWVFGLGRFSVWFWRLSAPAMVGLGAMALLTAKRKPNSRLHTALVVGTIGGLIGTAGYDVFRLPFMFVGYRLLAPIDSYGVLLMGAKSSSPLTGFAGWMFHVSNGVGFGIAYAVVALRRPWPWAVLWAMVLETATVLTPFVDTYALRGKWNLIAIAYAAHVFYGLPLGRWVERVDVRMAQLHDMTKRPAVLALAIVTAGVLIWHHPWATNADDLAGERLARGPSAVVRNERFAPKWLHVAVNGCATLRNDDATAYTVKGGDRDVSLAPHATTRVCFARPGVHRVRTTATPDAGGFVIVDEELT